MWYFTFSVVLHVKIAMWQVLEGSAHATGEVRRPLSRLTPGSQRFDLSLLEIAGELELLVDSGHEREIGYVVIDRITID